MTNKEKIVLYLDNQMTSGEKENFEMELINSKKLRDELEYYKLFNTELKSLEYSEATEEYYNSLIPRFKEKLKTKNNRKYIPILSYGVSALALILISVLLFFNKNEKNDVVIIDNNLTNEEASELINNYSDSVEPLEIPEAEEESTSQMLDSLIIAELDLGEGEDNLLVSENEELTDIVEKINETEADYIYGQIINKQFFGRKQ